MQHTFLWLESISENEEPKKCNWRLLCCHVLRQVPIATADRSCGDRKVLEVGCMI